MLENLPEFMTVEQAARALQLGRSKAYELTAEWEESGHTRGLPFVRFGHQKRVPRDALLAHVRELLAPT